MSVRAKTILIVFATLTGLIGGVYLISRWILLESYVRLEADDTRRNLGRALNALNDDLGTLARTTFDYAAWDDTYAYIQDPTPAYEENNMIESTFINNQLNAVVFVNLAGEVVFGRGFDLDTGQFAPLPRAWQSAVFTDQTLLNHATPESEIRGLVVLEEEPYLVASRPIITSLQEGPIRGALLMARALNAVEVARLAQTTRLAFRLAPFTSADTDLVTIRPALTLEQPELIRPLDENTVAAYALLADLGGAPALIMRLTLDRHIYRQGQASLLYLLVALVVAGLVFGGVMALALEGIVLRRLGRLSHEVAAIADSGNFTGRVTEEGRDELSGLGATINRMLGALAQLNKLLDAEREKVERLLLNVLPVSIADRLKQETATIADSFAEATILFADIVDFTKMAALTSPEAMVALLNDVFSEFDHLAEKHGLEKIKTIGDAYMVVGGLPVHRPDHANAVADMALDMQALLRRFNTGRSMPVEVRIGINTGPVVAGVIGTKKFLYDLWGDTVNTASRMESFGVSGRIQITEATYDKLRDHYLFEERGSVSVKGKGEMFTYFLIGRK